MKTLLTITSLIFTVVLSSIFSSVTSAGSVDGKGVYCPSVKKGYWFEIGRVNGYFIKGYNIIVFGDKARYTEKSSTHISWYISGDGRSKLNRETLKINETHQCQLVLSKNGITGPLQRTIEAAKKKNKI